MCSDIVLIIEKIVVCRVRYVVRAHFDSAPLDERKQTRNRSNIISRKFVSRSLSSTRKFHGRFLGLFRLYFVYKFLIEFMCFTEILPYTRRFYMFPASFVAVSIILFLFHRFLREISFWTLKLWFFFGNSANCLTRCANMFECHLLFRQFGTTPAFSVFSLFCSWHVQWTDIENKRRKKWNRAKI